MTSIPLMVGLDIGGTKVHAVAVDAAGTVVEQVRLPTGTGAEAVLESITSAVELLAERVGISSSEFRSIGVGIPGSVDSENGRVANAVNLGVQDLDLGAELTTRFGVPVRIENDVNAAALGAWQMLEDPSIFLGADEFNLGSLREGPRAAHSISYLNLGTGLAAGIVINGGLWRGSRGTAGEIGHIPVEPNGAVCGCGQRGCLETLASGSAVARQWPTENPLPVVEVFEAADQGDALAIEVRDRLVNYTAAAVRILILSIDVDFVIVGGGLSALGEKLLGRVRGVLDTWALSSPFVDSLELSRRVLFLLPGSPVAALGAAFAGQATGVDRAPKPTS